MGIILGIAFFLLEIKWWLYMYQREMMTLILPKDRERQERKLEWTQTMDVVVEAKDFIFLFEKI